MSSPYPAETNGGVVTSWIPLTTSFASVSGCSNSYMLEGPSLVAFDPGYGLSINPEATCQPSAVTTWWEQARLGGGSGPGHTAVSILPLTCPDGWSTVATSISDSTTTQAMCCPPGYYLANGQPGSIAGNCLSSVLAGATLTYASTPLDNSNSWTITSTTLAEASDVGAIAIVGWNVQLANTISTTSSTSPTSVASSSQTPLAASPTSSTASSGGLSTGAEAGIGVGVALGVIGLMALMAAIWLSRRRKQKAASERDAHMNVKEQPVSTDPAWRLYGQQPSELDSRYLPRQVVERAELDTNPTT